MNAPMTVVQCDACRDTRQAVDHDLRQVLAEGGWFCDDANNFDLCPACLAQLDEEETAHLLRT